MKGMKRANTDISSFTPPNRPRITISIIAPNHALDQELITLDLPPGLSVGDLKGFVNAETHLPQAAQQFYLNNTPIAGDDKTLEEAGVKDGDMLAMLMRQPEQPNNMNAQRRQQRRPAGRSPHEIETSRLSILGNPAAMAQVREQRPALAEAINDTNWFKEVWEKMDREDAEREQERREQMALLNEDPFNVEAQRKIEEMIRQESVQENLQFAYEHNPEVFGRVTMLYIPVEVNRHPVKAFVDSGAQTTIMSPSCAETCGIMRLIDKRYSGIAKGVGTAQILGRVHAADIRIGNSTMSCSFTVMEGKDVDLLLGLDMLKRFQAVIDLRGGKLVFGDGGNEVQFLGEADIPKGFEEARGREDVVEGPNGTEIGVESGTVRQAGASSSSSAGQGSSVGGTTNGFRGPGQALGAASSSSKSGKAAVNGPTHAPTPASTQRASRSAPASAPTPAATSSTVYPKEAIDQLVSLGFARNQAIAALDACGGDVEYAAGLLFQS
ncbi:DNA damage-inducible protein 1 [Friedmanniomyces endolithicus]|uniref:DNA damage-inducible protein 1 n=1 Tax=Friedmanniomyces endolithicus TaxID=329885 RepID=A0AAN6JCP4_9PEZI|nr:DNA damage-inducible protein 1 [Friedmanniomyces endolithicus]KAK0293362.1 DNA damage-inducible protein 1 [Friedmanniomyces endolithicus]KAK0325569.1 DNA damage-inducible protein 1 [Friedmanniomyces endolithicus]KAK0911525.1 DNA damage-inducible protein 1 [Friedmanniomyces endolithicus]KAK0971645.1 DNA damage-inducible protein 1 [Friedmanniomyces endolithicus]